MSTEPIQYTTVGIGQSDDPGKHRGGTGPGKGPSAATAARAAADSAVAPGVGARVSGPADIPAANHFLVDAVFYIRIQY